ncbi:mechanosensitive ion channel family protein [Paramaledivibacter caminithermalis]|jgi:small conductance mechanosensitive channel|uniref:Small conductance mechanosensitive channel n=1 Tax=Paramaledivibacter caminithermalis (strain DSM 15212 / CIP 107654 / DViRD3) TaxID=1121301 RepID=A0A1M6Q4I4_PARC5|nr:mechanosensitive ion channel family protein [Paramaledivibacter caminithermalis]SHK15145.1 small conductance mechanosensitive channel [Paramaledivibacter caminithermalis DSM 15212]
MNLDNIKGLQKLNIDKINLGIRPFISSIIILILAFILIKLVMFSTKKVIELTKFNEQREKTVKSIIDSVAAYFIMTFAILTIMSEFGLIKKATILTGAGIFTLIAGLGAQNLIKDFINGFFLLFERQMKVGDFVAINEKYFGTVEEIGLRATAIRDWSLTKLYIPNGEIKTLKNYYKEKSRVIVQVIVPFEEDHTEVEKALKEVCAMINEKYEDRLYRIGNTNYSEFDLMGVISFNGMEGGAKYIITGVVIPRHRWFIRNRIYEEILRIFSQRNLKIGYPRVWFKDKETE